MTQVLPVDWHPLYITIEVQITERDCCVDDLRIVEWLSTNGELYSLSFELNSPKSLDTVDHRNPKIVEPNEML